MLVERALETMLSLGVTVQIAPRHDDRGNVVSDVRVTVTDPRLDTTSVYVGPLVDAIVRACDVVVEEYGD